MCLRSGYLAKSNVLGINTSYFRLFSSGKPLDDYRRLTEYQDRPLGAFCCLTLIWGLIHVRKSAIVVACSSMLLLFLFPESSLPRLVDAQPNSFIV